MKELFRKIHTKEFRWYDQFILVGLMSFILVIFGQLIGYKITNTAVEYLDPESPIARTAVQYFVTVGVWIVMVTALAINKRRRPILKTFGTWMKGNNIKNLLIGLLIGFGLNFSCAAVAMLNRDIHIHFDTFDPLGLLIVFICVFVQSSSEEIVDRGYFYQVLRKGYRSPWFAIIVTALAFSSMHFFNPGFTLMSFLNILASGLMFAEMVYYFDSIWMPFGVHTAWNYTQNIILGLPNSGLVMPFSLFKLDTASAVDSFAYNVAFGIEGTLFSTILLYAACIAVFLIGRKRGVKSQDIWVREEDAAAEEEPLINE